MRAGRQLIERWRRDPARMAGPVVVLLFALLVYTRSLDWGLPGGDETWAADALKPSAPLAVAYQNFAGHGWNSGWFWFKYPPFHAFLLCGFYAPFLLWLWLAGGIHGFSSDYPYGLTDPVASLSMLAWIGRATSALMGAGCAMLVHQIVVASFGRRAAIAAAFVTTMAYPMVFYSQTTNVEVPYTFWMLLGLLGAVRVVEGDDRARWWMALGAGAALSVSTKELAAGGFVLLPLAIVGASLAARRPVSSWMRGGAVAAATFLLALGVANNAFYNPQGFANRIGFLTQTLPREVALQYAPYYFPIDLGGSRGASVEMAQLSIAFSRLTASLGWPTLVLALAGWLVALRRRPAWALVLLAMVAGYYLVSVRAMLSLSLRYLLPMTVLFCVAAGVALAELLREGRLRPLRAALASVAVLYVFAYGWDVNRMMNGDGRYGAERWLATAPLPSRVEIYQNRTYLPRFPVAMTVAEVDFEQRGIAEFESRRPDLVVLSSSGLSGVTVRYKEDWQTQGAPAEGYSPAQMSIRGQVMNYSRDANREFLDALRSGGLGYEEAARFAVEPWIDRLLIQSLNPEITIYRRSAGSPQAGRAAASPAPPAPPSTPGVH
ncbi:MAG: ArnT family glycosyltransferase [Candidatus Binatia bacterium]